MRLVDHRLDVARRRSAKLVDYRRLLDQAVKDTAPYPRERFSGRGVVICGGGTKYFPCAWVTIRRLRQLGVTLPIELWHLGPAELSPEMEALVTPYQVTCVDALRIRALHPVARLNGWELKPFSVLHSAFEEVLLLDADNVPVVDPTFLFDAREYRDTAGVFWPDRWRKPGDPHRHLQPQAWAVCGLAPIDGPECESGQLLVNKARAWQPLRIAMHLNEHSAYYYSFFHGDKDTYRIAFTLCGTPYAMPSTPVRTTPGGEVFFQHDFAGSVLFQHRIIKWQLGGKNRRFPDFRDEAVCLELLRELGQRWDGRIRSDTRGATRAREAFDRVAEVREFDYERVGHDHRLLELLPDGSIGLGAARLERHWDVELDCDGAPRLIIEGSEGVICRLDATPGGEWRGSWTRFEAMPVVLRPRREARRARALSGPVSAQISAQRFFEYRRVGYDFRIIELCPDGRIGRGRARLELCWSVDESELTAPVFLIHGEEGIICRLTPDGETWRGRWAQFEQMPIVLTPRPELTKAPGVVRSRVRSPT